MSDRGILQCLFFTTLLCGMQSGCQNARPAATKLDQIAIHEALVKLQGEWALESSLDDGSPLQSDWVYVFGETEYTEKRIDRPIFDMHGNATFRFKFTIYNIEKQLVMKTIVESAGGTGFERHTIFRFRDDKLEMCYLSEPSRVDDIPATFDGKAGSGQCLTILRKRPKKPE
jgi:hypothetical protein